MKKQSKKEIIAITEAQVHQFAGNMLQVRGTDSKYLVMSLAAHNSLAPSQIKQIEKHCETACDNQGADNFICLSDGAHCRNEGNLIILMNW